MATYTYEALNSAGKPQKGTIEAGTTEEAIQRIKAQGFYPTSVREQAAKKNGPAEGEGAKLKKAKGGGFALGEIGRAHV